MEEKTDKKELKKGKIMLVDNELVKVLDKLRGQINQYGWGAIEVQWVDLTRILARKINAINLIK